MNNVVVKYMPDLRESLCFPILATMDEYFEIPYMTETDWELGNRRVPPYLLRLMAYKIQMEKLADETLAVSMYKDVPKMCRRVPEV